MKSLGVFCLLLWTLAGLTVSMAAQVESEKGELLRTKMAAIDLVREKLARRLDEADKVRLHLDEMLNELMDEIAYDCESFGIETYPQASVHPRMDRSLRLARQLFSYLDVVREQIRLMKEGDQQLVYLRQEAVDSLEIIAVIRDMDIRPFVQEADRLVAACMQQAQSRLFKVGEISYQHTEQTWQRVHRRQAS